MKLLFARSAWHSGFEGSGRNRMLSPLLSSPLDPKPNPETLNPKP